MDEEKQAITVRSGKLAEKLPATLIAGAIGGGLELLSRPENRPLGADIESIGVKHRALIVVAEQRHLAGFHHPIDALARIGPVADDVAEAENLVDSLGFDIFEHHLQGF